MPLYEYRCEECGVRFERRQKFNDAPVSVCPECNGPVHRVIGTTGIIFKGSGFYVTDNRKSKGRVQTASSSKNSDKDTGSDSKASKDAGDSKPKKDKSESK